MLARKSGKRQMDTEIELHIDTLAFQGGGVARHTEGTQAGKKVFVLGALPGDTVMARILSQDKRHDQALCVRVIEPSPARRAAACPASDSCGGCPLQTLARSEQLRWKRRFVEDALMHIGGFAQTEVSGLMQDCVSAGDEWGYRNKVEFEVAAQGNRLALGMHSRGSEVFVPVERCLLLPKGYEDAPKRLAGALSYALKEDGALLRRVGIRVSRITRAVEVALWMEPGPCKRSFVARVIGDALPSTSLVRVLIDGETAARKVKGVEALAGRGYWRESLNDYEYRISAPSFFQVNTPVAQRMVTATLDLLKPTGKRVLDLYSGAGSFTLPLAEHASEVEAVELEGSSIRDLRRNLEVNGLDALAHGGDVARMLPDLVPADAAIIDPPRSGLSPEARTALIAARIPLLAYVSCDPTTLARDLRALVTGGYEVRNVLSYDLFPQTYHVESLVLLESCATR